MHKTCMFYTTQEIKYVMNVVVQIRNAQWMYISDYRHFYNVIVNAFESAIPNLLSSPHLLVKFHFNFSDDTEPGNFISQYSM